MANRARLLKELERSGPLRRPKECMLIVGEGETEQLYFGDWKRRLVFNPDRFIVATNHDSAPISVVTEAERLNDTRSEVARDDDSVLPFDQVWCVIDVERPEQNNSLHRAIRKAVEKSFRLAISNPSIEVWFLYHFRDLHSALTDAATAKQLLRRHLPGYQELLAKLVSHTDRAILRAESRFAQAHSYASDVCEHNPSPRVFELIREIQVNGGSS